jgi:hypothetical protein
LAAINFICSKLIPINSLKTKHKTIKKSEDDISLIVIYLYKISLFMLLS